MHKTVGCLEGHPAGNSRVNTYLLIKKIKRYMDLFFCSLSGKLTVGGRVFIILDCANK